MLRWATTLLSCCLAVDAGADDQWGHSGSALFEDQEGVPVVLTPARLRQPQSEVPASVTVINREMIRASGAREVYQLLRLVPGMNVAKVDGNVPTVSYHGTAARDNRRMLVMVDGRSEYLPGLARVLWNDIPLTVEDIERIEITRGPSSAMYGANAFSGVINIITRHPEDESGASLLVRDGNNGVRDVRGSIAGRSDNAAMRLTLSRQSDDGYDDPDSPRYQRDGKAIESFNFRSSFDLSPASQFDFLLGAKQGHLQREDPDEVLAVGEPESEFREHSNRAYMQARWKHFFSDAHQLKVQVYGVTHQTRQPVDVCGTDLQGNRTPGAAIYFTRELRDVFEDNDRDMDATQAAAFQQIFVDGSGPLFDRYASLISNPALPAFCYHLNVEIEENSYDLEIEDTLSLGERVRLVTGINLRYDEGRSDYYTRGRHSNTSYRLFSSLEVAPLNALRVNLGGYWETDDLNGTFFSPRAALIWRPAAGHGVRLVHAEAIRTPDIYEQRADFGFVPYRLPAEYQADPVAIFGWQTPELFVTQESDGDFSPERIRSRELGYFGRLGSFELDLRLFEEELRNLIVGSLNPSAFDTDDDGEVDHRGWETQIGWRPHPRHLLRLTYARVRTDVKYDDRGRYATQGRFATEHSGSALWAMDLPGGAYFASAYYTARDYNQRGDPARYEKWNNQLAYRWSLATTELELRAVVERNLSGDPEVFAQNSYRDRDHYWFQGTVRF